MSDFNFLETYVLGRIEQVSKANNGGFFTVILSPAKDSYSHPNYFRVYSTKPLGKKGDEIDALHCSLSSVRRSFEYLNKETQIKERGFNYDIYLNVIE